MPTCPYGESVSVCVPYMYPSVCVCVLAMMSSHLGQWSGSSDGVYVCFLNKETGGHAQRDTRHGVSRAQREPYALSATNVKTTELNYNHRVTTASSAQYTQTTEKDSGEGRCKKDTEAEREIEKRQPSLLKRTHTKGTDKGTANYTQLDHELNFREIIGHYVKEACGILQLNITGMCCSYLHKIRVNKYV